ncbi:MAG: hypothetical protein UX56_C0001G0015 [Candidatus Azambacteria bacterium GW2011_GWD2_46_48]|uniref:Uncharacterized protein n=1 Tax=Candidatus Azambacteria bacterium GW2011_GWD2_46_48 TaxID=1618623 RepID=A0A0G1TC28_9BACT|nr:MAG: hypothetical protein UX56_C0001G0015 [Candidatus Azambacteria bacterium GW2011_GWD2_46_48]
MDTRTQKQVIIAIFFLGILFFIGGGFYFAFRSPASCFDKIQNQGEEDIDCGGPCATACEEKELKPLEIFFQRKFLRRGGEDKKFEFKIRGKEFLLYF